MNLRWVAVAVFALASTWNYLDRGLLAAAGPAINAEFHLSHQDFGWLLSAFGLSYALASPAVGWFLDRVGVHRGILCAVGLWSLATLLTGWSETFVQLLGARVFLGIWESAGVPAAGKLNAMYLPPSHRAIGAAVTQVGLSLGAIAAPRMINAFPAWRSPFFVCGALGILWIPLWMAMHRAVPPAEAASFGNATPKVPSLTLMRDPRLLRLSVANFLWMGIYTLSSNWATIFITTTFGISTSQANDYAWFPPIASTLGAFTGGWLSMRRIRVTGQTVPGRLHATLLSAVGCTSLLLATVAPTPLLATLAVSFSYFWVTAGSVNIYTIPVDIWGGANAGTAISALVISYGLLQMAISPVIGKLVDQSGGFTLVFWLLAFTPLAAWLLLRKLGMPKTRPAVDQETE